MNDLTCDIGYKSINHAGEQLCGDHVEVVEQEDGSTVIVLADGLGSGVKASILSTLTSKIISTMLAAGLSIEECVETIAATLPVDSMRGVAYSTFTIIRLIRNQTAELIQYDNPQVIVLRDGENWAAIKVVAPAAVPENGARAFELEFVAECEGGTKQTKLVVPEGFNHAPSHPKAASPSFCLFAKDELGAGKVRFTVTPVNCFGARGKPIVAEWTPT